MRVSRFEDLPKDLCVELLHFISDEYERRLKKQRQCTDEVLNAIRARGGHLEYIWKCAEHDCPVLTDYETSPDLMSECDICCNNDLNRFFLLCPQHDKSEAWYYIYEACPTLRDMMGDEEGCACIACYDEFVKPHFDRCSCVVRHKNLIVDRP
jgi:hypothetical protein